MKWIENHVVLTIVILIVVVYLANTYGSQLLASASGNTAQPNVG